MAAVNELIFTQNIKGGIYTTGNTLGLFGITNPPISNATIPVIEGENKADGIGAFTTVDTSQQYTNFPSGTTVTWSLNSSSNLLTIPSGSRILSAWLFYGATQINGEQDVTAYIRNPITFVTPSGASHAVTPSPSNVQSLYVETGRNTIYHARINVTSVMEGSGYYTVGSVPGCLGKDGNPDSYGAAFAGWTLVVAVENPLLPNRNLTIWDVFDIINTNASSVPYILDIPITGFTTPPMGYPLNGRLFITAAEGDNYILREYVQFGPNASNLNFLSGPNNYANNFFQSQINDDDGNLMTTGTFGNSNVPPLASLPAPFTTQSGRFGWDKTAIDVSNLLQNKQQSALIRLFTEQDSYYIQTVALQIDLLSAVIFPTKEVSKASAMIGDTITFTINFTNTGRVQAEAGTVITDLIDSAFMYKAGTVSVNVPFTGDPTTAITITNAILPSETVTIRFDVQVQSIPIPNPASNTATVEYRYIPGEDMPAEIERADTNTVKILVRSVGRGVEFI